MNKDFDTLKTAFGAAQNVASRNFLLSHGYSLQIYSDRRTANIMKGSFAKWQLRFAPECIELYTAVEGGDMAHRPTATYKSADSLDKLSAHIPSNVVEALKQF